MTHLVLYLATLVVFLGLDAVWLRAVMKPLFERHLGDMLLESPKLGAAAGFYAVYVVGIVWFAGVPGLREGWPAALLNGLLLGVLAYGTYEMTNMSTLKRWSWTMVASDMAWGAALTGVSAAAGVLIARALGFGSGA